MPPNNTVHALIPALSSTKSAPADVYIHVIKNLKKEHLRQG